MWLNIFQMNDQDVLKLLLTKATRKEICFLVVLTNMKKKLKYIKIRM